MSGSFVLRPDGSDEAPEGPWATPAGARDALRRLRAEGKVAGEAVVELQEGTYRLTGPLDFGPEDSQATWKAAPGAQPILDGGRVLTGWTETEHRGRRAWVLDLPEVAAGRWYFRSLFASGVRQPRARFPKFSPTAEGGRNTLRLGEIRFPERRGLFDGDNAFKPVAGDWGDWPSLPEAEIVLLHYWVETRLPHPRLNPTTGWVSCSRRSVFNLYESFNPNLARYYVDNLFEALTDPGEWYLDRFQGRLTYLPHPEQTLATTTLVAPVLTRFIEVAGLPERQHPVEALAFEGLTFRHSDWYQPLAEMLPHDKDALLGVTDLPLGSAPQSAVHVPAVVRWRWAQKGRFERNTVELTGFSALEFGPGCRDCRAVGNTLQDLGGGGIKIGGTDVQGPWVDRTAFVDFTDNTVRRVGRVFHQSCGILLTHASDCCLVHNEIAHTCYTGISVGWTWGFGDNLTRNILIENNLIHDICEGVLSDNGGIYLLGVQPGTVVRGNHIYRVTAADYGGSGIYPDEGSSHIVMEHNWVHDVQGSCLGLHFARELVVRHNVFARPGEAFAGIGRVEQATQGTLMHNVFLGPAKALYCGAYRGDIRTGFATDANVIGFQPEAVPPCTHPDWRTDVPHSLDLAQWWLAGNDRQSLVCPIPFQETSTMVTFPPDSPVFSTGFRPYDWSVCGPRS